MPRASGAGVGALPRNFRLRNRRLFCLSIYTFFVSLFLTRHLLVCGGRQDALRDWLAGSLPPILRHRKWEEKKV